MTPPARPLQRPAAPHATDGRPVLITGGAGFVGTSLADRLAREGHRVVVLDNLARAGVERNLTWLKQTHGAAITVEIADIRDGETVARVVSGAGAVFHFAAQVAVTTSLAQPLDDFDVNARGTLNLLEAVRAVPRPPPLVFTSTNKVYGRLDDLSLQETDGRWQPADAHVRDNGIGEDRPLDFHSPYGCSKGCADQYVVDYARTFGIPAVVLRMSCIYGPHQFGTEDQGWVAHFLISTLQGRPITLYGDGKQVRDILFVDDLVEALLLARGRAADLAGRAFNIGGGPDNATSLKELLNLIGELTGRRPDLGFGTWRPGDQRYYVSNTARFRAVTGWSPRVSVRDGVTRLARWLAEERDARDRNAHDRHAAVSLKQRRAVS
ncbi:MAG TPA: NAD-dependent epimerase/dehydratase family protein [Arenibaculum sp.]|nr:NAD-dependent epimerase/dehydratase family protein [Arenibaculum sp.]